MPTKEKMSIRGRHGETTVKNFVGDAAAEGFTRDAGTRA
ncbi:unnamed protein product [Brassica oleracea]